MLIVQIAIGVFLGIALAVLFLSWIYRKRRERLWEKELARMSLDQLKALPRDAGLEQVRLANDMLEQFRRLTEPQTPERPREERPTAL
jgi:uncharacterized membrane protein YccC